MVPVGDAVLARLKGYLERDPENWALRADYFDAALAAGERALARALVAHALERRPGDAAWRHREAMVLLAEARYPEAQGVLEALLAQGVDAPAVRHNLAWALFAQGRWESASDAVAPLLDVADEGAAGAPALWLRCQHRLGRLAEGLTEFRRLRAVRELPPDALGVASLMALDEGGLDEAGRLADAAIAGRADQLEALAVRGTLRLAEQDAPGALEWFGRGLRVNPQDGRTWSGIAFARMLGLDFQGAVEAFENAVRWLPEHQGTWIGFGWCRLLSRDLAGARAAFERAIGVDRTIAEPHGGLAAALARLGDREGAQRELEIASRLDRTNLSSYYAQAILDGVADDPVAFKALAQKVLSNRPLGLALPNAQTVADLVFRGRRAKGS
jgi:tetratricopeptide (TPR) repeat protein